MIFAWDETNLNHLAKHGVTPSEAQFVVERSAAPFPQELGDGKRRVWGGTESGRLLQVIYVLKKQNQVAFDSVEAHGWAELQDKPNVKIARIIHAMNLTAEMKRQLHRRRR